MNGVIASTDVLCFGEATGNVSIAVSNGTAPYSYSWQNTTTVFANDSSGLLNVIADDYQVTVTDNNGCIYVDNVTVNEPIAPVSGTVRMMEEDSIASYGCRPSYEKG